MFENPNPEKNMSVNFININFSPVANIVLTDGVIYNNTDTEKLLTSKYVHVYNHGPKGITLNLVKDELKNKQIKINIQYTILTNKMYMTEIILKTTDFDGTLLFDIIEQNQIKIKKNQRDDQEIDK